MDRLPHNENPEDPANQMNQTRSSVSSFTFPFYNYFIFDSLKLSAYVVNRLCYYITLSRLSAMKILAWNIQGSMKFFTRKHLKTIVRKEKPDIIFLSETKATETKTKELLNSLGFNNLSIIHARGKAGGLGLGWKDFLNISIIHSNTYIIHALITDTAVNKVWILSYVWQPLL